MKPRAWPWLDLIVLAALCLMLLTGCSSAKAKTIIIEDWTYQIPLGRVDETMSRGWKGWI